jgi:hypothetical protein
MRPAKARPRYLTVRAQAVLFLVIGAVLTLAVGIPSKAPISSQGCSGDPSSCAPKYETEIVKRWRLSAIPEGSWCSSGCQSMGTKDVIMFGKMSAKLAPKSLTLSGIFKVISTGTEAGIYEPTAFYKAGEPAEDKNHTVSLNGLEKFFDVEVCGANGEGIGILRFQTDWRGTTCGPLTGWRFELGDRNLYLIDADLDGIASEKDRVMYEGSRYWMPWHRVTRDSKLQYFDMTLAEGPVIRASTAPLGDLGEDADVAQRWNITRVAYGVPPGVFDSALGSAARKHADYLKLNRLAAHEEDPKLPGYSEEGNLAGLSSLITFEGKDGAVNGMMGTFYHRRLMLDPSYSVFYVGGNEYAFCLGIANIRTRLQSKLPAEARTMPRPLMSPAPDMQISYTSIARELPIHPCQKGGQKLGYPALVILPNYSSDEFKSNPTDVKAQLQVVKGSISSGKTSGVVKCYLSYPGFNCPQSDPHNAGTVALTPEEPLKVGVYEASFEFKYLKQTYSLRWRFEVIAK